MLRMYSFLEPVLNADETPTRVLKIDGKPSKKRCQMWVVCTGASASKKIALYYYRDSRSKVTAEKLLEGYTGVVQTDGLQSYGSGDYESAGSCWRDTRESCKRTDCSPTAAEIMKVPAVGLIAADISSTAYPKEILPVPRHR